MILFDVKGVAMFRNVIAVIVGLAVGMMVNMALVLLNLGLHPMPEGVNFDDPEGVKAYFATLPLMAYLIVLLAHLGQSFVGGLVAALISATRPMLVAMIVGVLSLIGGLINMTDMPLPMWMWIEIPLYLVVSWAAGSIVVNRRAHPTTES